MSFAFICSDFYLRSMIVLELGQSQECEGTDMFG